jgi:hypothetical protein
MRLEDLYTETGCKDYVSDHSCAVVNWSTAAYLLNPVTALGFTKYDDIDQYHQKCEAHTQQEGNLDRIMCGNATGMSVQYSACEWNVVSRKCFAVKENKVTREHCKVFAC